MPRTDVLGHTKILPRILVFHSYWLWFTQQTTLQRMVEFKRLNMYRQASGGLNMGIFIMRTIKGVFLFSIDILELRNNRKFFK